MTTPAEIEEKAAWWLMRRDDADWAVVDEQALEAWLDETTANRVTYYRLEYGWQKAERITALGAQPPRHRAWTGGWRPAALAASLAGLAVFGGALFMRTSAPQATSYSTEIGGHQTVPLSDGSRIELNTDTRVRTSITESKRAVWLDNGEAYFEVAHDAAHPFVVFAGNRKVTVLGTKFSVRRDGLKVKVAVAEGRVRVEPIEPEGRTGPEILTRGAIAIAEGPSTVVTPGSPERVAGELSWRRGMLTFQHVTLADAAAELNRYNRKKLVITDPKIAESRIGGTFDAESVDTFARLLKEAYGLKVEDEGDTIKISS